MLMLTNTLYGMNEQYQNLLKKTKGKGKEVFALLGDLHGIISGFKAISTWNGEKFAE